MSSITLKNIKKIYPITPEEIKQNKRAAKKRQETAPDEDFVKAPENMVFDAFEIDGVRYEIGASYTPIANAKINDEQQRAAGIEIIKSFETLSASDAKPLVTSLEFIKESKPETAGIVDDCLKHLEDIKSVKGLNKDKLN